MPPLKAGKARIYLKGSAQPQQPGVSANRNIDLVYLTRDTADDWMKHYRKQTNLYPILDAFRDSRGPRYEVRFTNRGDKPADFHILHVYNRLPWGVSEADPVRGVAPGASSDWVPLRMQDTAHFSLVRFSGSAKMFDVEVRPLGGAVERKLSGEGPLQVYLPPYPGKGEKAITPIEELDAVLAELKKTPAIGKKPTQPLCFGGWMPLGVENEYGRKYAQLYAALGFRSLHPANSGPAILKNLQAAGVPPSKSWAATGYRNPPTRGQHRASQADAGSRWFARTTALFRLRRRDRLWASGCSCACRAKSTRRSWRTRNSLPSTFVSKLWVDWLRANRPDVKIGATTGWKNGARSTPAACGPTAAPEAAAANPRLYVDSLLFYEETAIRFVAGGMKDVKKALGEDVLCGANYSCHPFYYPHSTMYVKWFREGAADLGRHSEYFWQVAQAGPMINGYIAEHFRAGMRDNPNAVLRQYTMPHSPGNTEANFLRSAYYAPGPRGDHARFLRHRHERNLHREPHRPPRPCALPCSPRRDARRRPRRGYAAPIPAREIAGGAAPQRQHRALGLRGHRRGFRRTRPVRPQLPQDAAQRSHGPSRPVDGPDLPRRLAGPRHGGRRQREGVEGLQGAGGGRRLSAAESGAGAGGVGAQGRRRAGDRQRRTL